MFVKGLEVRLDLSHFISQENGGKGIKEAGVVVKEQIKTEFPFFGCRITDKRSVIPRTSRQIKMLEINISANH